MKVYYGGVAFQLVKTDQLVREPQLSDDKTEMLYMRTKYALTMIYSPGSTSFVGGSGAFEQSPGNDPGATDVAIRYHLLKPRQQFLLVDDAGATILSVPPVGYDRDPEHGPTPLSCSVVSVAPKTWRVSWSVQVATIECGFGAGDFTNAVPPIVSNRFAQTSETGPDRLTRLTTRGISVFRADALAALRTTADYYRSRCIPGLPLGFRRESIHVEVNTAGTALSWMVVDQETMVSINNNMGVEGFEANFSMSSLGPEGGVPTAFTLARFDGFAWGNKTSSRQGLFGWLAKLAIERMALPNGQVVDDTTPIILRVTASEKLDKPAVELHIDAKLPPARNPKKGFGPLRTDFLGVDLLTTFSNDGKSPQMPQDNNTRGTANVLAMVAAVKEACGTIPDLPDTSYKGVGSPGDSYTASQPAVTVVVADGLPSTTTRFSASAATQGTYTEMKIQSNWSTGQGKYAAAIAGKVQSDGGYVSGGGSGGGTTGGGTTGGGTSGSGTGGTSGDGPADDDQGDEEGADEEKPSVSILTLSRPKTTLDVIFEAERCGTPPTIPDANSTAKNLVLLKEDISPMAVALAGDGVTPVFRVGGRYKYVALKPRKPSSSLYFGVHPFTDFVFGDTLAGVGSGSSNPEGSAAENANFYSHGLFDPPEAPSSSGGTEGGGTSGATGTTE